MGWGRNVSQSRTLHFEGSKGYIVIFKKEYKAMLTSENRCCVDKIT